MDKKRVKIEVYLNQHCKSEAQLRENISKALELEGLEAEVTFSRIQDEEAERLKLRGSPTIKINGEEVQPISQEGFG